MPILIELDAFSGRPNPQWALSEEQARRLIQLLSSLPPAAEAPAADAGLGYRGFKVSGVPGEGELVVRGAAIRATQPGRAGDRRDAGRAVESFLLETARGHLPDALLQTMASLLGA